MRAWSYFDVDPVKCGSDGPAGTDPEAQSSAETQSADRDSGKAGLPRRDAEHTAEVGASVERHRARRA